MSQETVTTDLADFGSRERGLLIELLQAWQSGGLPSGFSDDNVRAAMNKNSGFVFLTNDDYAVAMMNGDKLESFYSTPYEGHEGFLSDLLAEYAPDDLSGEDARFLRELIESDGLSGDAVPEAWRVEDAADEDGTGGQDRDSYT
jgi:hypothetical protein